MEKVANPYLTRADTIVLANLLQDIEEAGHPASPDGISYDDQTSMNLLAGLDKEPTVFTGLDQEGLGRFKSLGNISLQPYITWAQSVVRRPTDVVFLTHILLYLATSIPSAIFLFYRFSWTHGVCHWLMQAYYSGPFTLMLHNHIHGNGVLDKKYAWFDQSFPYVLGPLMGHTWDSYYYHHVKHHHVEGNGPGDLSSTIRYQRDELIDFLAYVGRFLAFVWIELPLYFVRKGRLAFAIKCFVCETSSYLAIYLLATRNFRPTLFVFMLPLLQMRIAMMIGNWGQHAFVDEVEPDSDFRSSITLIDVSSNRYCFNDGYHTSHHLNPRRHWRQHPINFIKAKSQYQNERALVFRNIDYLMITFKLLQKDYDHLAKCLVPMGDQIKMNHQELADMLRTKAKQFSEADIQKKFHKTEKENGNME
ncbi:MAG: hypothetical protein M1834_002416 [Cirrosporium novae-zelandiae]|nr:MAG: hypothetical protein M1834_002416 [Cirrosporium novae-zelandiae]